MYSEPKSIVKTSSSFYLFFISNRSHGEKLIELWEIKRFYLLPVHIPFRLAIDNQHYKRSHNMLDII